ncbi:MAG: RNA polymerase sigma factor [Lachnospiraceae bacterium]|nr:RNA polymerase sigma factor [Lachnospiraceae bacterium]
MKSDEELYRLFLDGHTECYDELMVRLGDALTAYLKGYLQSFEDAEDLMIEAFANIMAKKPKIKQGFKAYLFRTAHNLVYHLYVKKNKVKVFSLDDIDDEITADGENFEDKICRDAQEKALHRCIERLDPELREAVWLVYFEKLSYEQAAGVMDVSKKKVDYWLTRAKTVLKKEMEKEGYSAYA